MEQRVIHIKKWLKSSWGISIGTAIFSFLLTLGYDVLKDKPVFSTIWMILKAIGKFFVAFLNFELKVWWIIVGIIIIIGIIYALYKGYDKKEETKPAFLKYKNDYFKHWRWSWEWKWSDYKNAWCVSNLTAHCPKCDTAMVDHSSYYDGIRFACPRCNFTAFDNECDQIGNVERVIIDNLNRKTAFNEFE